MPWPIPSSPGELTPEEQVGWEEVYGPDYPLSPGDVPVLANSLCRVRFDSTGKHGFRIDVWDPDSGDSGAWSEQGKVVPERSGDSGLVFPQLVSAAVLEWSPDRAVVLAVMQAASDALSRERVLITLQRGWTGPRFEMYAPPVASGAPAIVGLIYTVAAADSNDSVVKLDDSPAAIAATAGSGSALFGSSGVTLGDTTFTGENIVALLRQGGAFQANFAVLQRLAAAETFRGGGYSTARNSVEIFAGGYVTAHVGFVPASADQVIEAESCLNGSSTTASVVSDSGASGGSAVKDTQATAAVLSTWKVTDLRAGVYRVIARVKVNLDLDLGGVKISNSTGFVQRAFSNIDWEWNDFGDLTFTVDDDGLGAYVFADFGGAYLDRIELVRLEDRTGPAATFGAARDLGQSVLYDARVDPRRVQRI